MNINRAICVCARAHGHGQKDVVTKVRLWVCVEAKDILQICVCVCVCVWCVCVCTWEDYTFKFYKPNCITYFTQSFTLNAMHIKHKTYMLSHISCHYKQFLTFNIWQVNKLKAHAVCIVNQEYAFSLCTG
jgi:hypothetical protein